MKTSINTLVLATVLLFLGTNVNGAVKANENSSKELKAGEVKDIATDLSGKFEILKSKYKLFWLPSIEENKELERVKLNAKLCWLPSIEAKEVIEPGMIDGDNLEEVAATEESDMDSDALIQLWLAAYNAWKDQKSNK